MQVLFDSCVILDIFLRRKGFCDDAEELLRRLSLEQYTGFIASSSVTDIYYVSFKHYHNHQKTRKALQILLDQVIILNTTRQDCHFALTSPIKDYEDAVLLETAAREQVDCLITRNPKDFTPSNIPVYTPAEFLKILK